MYYSKRLSKKRTIGAIAIILAILIAIPLCSNYYSTKTYTVRVTDKDVKNSGNSSKYLVFTKLTNGKTKTFCIQDDLFKLRWDSSDVYADVEIGATYDIEVIGWRIPFLSAYENIMKFSKTK